MNCYRHPDREAYVRCQRCERFICPACQTEAAVGFLCPEDAGKSGVSGAINAAAPASVRRLLSGDKPVVTYAIMALCTVVWLLQILPGSRVTQDFFYVPLATTIEPWRMLTAAFLHSTSSPLHLLMNMYTLFIIGKELEMVLGRGRFLAAYLLSAFGGSVGVLLLSDPTTAVVGASGALFGLMVLFIVVARTLGGDPRTITAIFAINLVLGFAIPGVAWQAHVGGAVTGLVVGLLYSRTRSAKAAPMRIIGLVAIAAALLALTLYGVGKIMFF
ncbi:MAG: rhomboid family intramembrane serine protease [Micrococcales bacterium]